MISRFAAIVAAALAFATPSSAQFGSMMLASELGDVIASEEFCGLSYDQAAIEAFIEAEVSADDMGFTSSLNMMVLGAQVTQEDMTESQKTAHCAQIRRVAGSYGFTE